MSGPHPDNRDLLEWGDPPKHPTSSIRGVPRSTIEALEGRPNQWAKVKFFALANTARGTATLLRRELCPAGYEVLVVEDEGGGAFLYMRFNKP